MIPDPSWVIRGGHTEDVLRGRHGHTESYTRTSYADQPTIVDSLTQLCHTWRSYVGFVLDGFCFTYNSVTECNMMMNDE